MMHAEFLQFLFSGLTVGATYALAALGFNLIYNASHVINFAQGEFIMLGGMLAVFFSQAGLPWSAAFALAILVPALAGILLEKLAIEPVNEAETMTLSVVTIVASPVIRGISQEWLGKGAHSLAPFPNHDPLFTMGAMLLPQRLWVFSVTALVMVVL